MFLLPIRLAAGALCRCGTAAAHAHAVRGDRIFPAILAIDDPGVTDELTSTIQLPTFPLLAVLLKRAPNEERRTPTSASCPV